MPCETIAGDRASEFAARRLARIPNPEPVPVTLVLVSLVLVSLVLISLVLALPGGIACQPLALASIALEIPAMRLSSLPTPSRRSGPRWSAVLLLAIAAASGGALAAAPVRAQPDTQLDPRADRRPSAQTLPQPALFRRSTVLPAGTPLPTTYPGAERVVVLPDETAPLTLTVAATVSADGAIVIPAGSEIDGALQPGEGGTQFVAETLRLPDGRSLPLAARSAPIARTETLRRGADGGTILKGAAIGAAAATVLSEVLGDIDLWEVLAGAGAGAAGGAVLGRRSVEVRVVDPADDLDLVLEAPLEVAR